MCSVVTIRDQYSQLVSIYDDSKQVVQLVSKYEIETIPKRGMDNKNPFRVSFLIFCFYVLQFICRFHLLFPFLLLVPGLFCSIFTFVLFVILYTFFINLIEDQRRSGGTQFQAKQRYSLAEVIFFFWIGL